MSNIEADIAAAFIGAVVVLFVLAGLIGSLT